MSTALQTPAPARNGASSAVGEPALRTGAAPLPTPPPVVATARRRRPWLVALAAFAVIIGGVWGARAFLRAQAYVDTDDAFIEGHVVQISPKVSAHVVKVYFDDNFEVKADQRLLDLDARDFEMARDRAQTQLTQAQAQVLRAKAGTEQARAQLLQAQAQVDQQAAQVVQARAQSDLAKINADRSNNLYGKDIKAIAREQVDTTNANLNAARGFFDAAQANFNAAKANLESTRAGSDAAVAQLAAAESDVHTAKVAVRDAELNLSYCAIDAPTSGRVTRKNVEAGNYVQPGQTLLAVVPHDVWVVANFKETQLTHMQPNQPVEVRVDTFPDRPLRGHVDSLQSGTGARFSLLPPENATGNYVKVVQRIPVKILLDEPADVLARLAPGMSVESEIKVR